MVNNSLNRTTSLAELHALIDRDRAAAAALAEATFHNDVNIAISTISEINAVAGARVSADTQVATAKIQIDAEVAATRLSADAQMAIARYKQHVESQPTAVPHEVVAAMVRQIGDSHSAQLSQQAEKAIDAIKRDAMAAIAKLKEIGNSAIDEIHDLAATVASNVERDADVAAEKLRAFRLQAHSKRETIEEADSAARKIEAAATLSAAALRKAVDAAIKSIRDVADGASRDIENAAKTATERISAARESALGTIRVVVDFHME